jgi:hypothetical protein
MAAACPKCERGGTGPHPSSCTPLMRFWRKVDATGDGCWEWQGASNGVGYGMIRFTRTLRVYAHRWIYEQLHGPIQSGHVIMHLCDNPRCVRPAHLRAGTQAENMQDMVRKGRANIVPRARKTHCVHGHAFTDENTYVGTDGYRGCRTCHRIGERARKQRLAAWATQRTAPIASVARGAS